MNFILANSETCVRQTPNLSIEGVSPLSRVPVGNARECIVQCIEQKAQCRSAVYYQLKDGSRVCQLFSGNSNSPGAKVVSQRNGNGEATNLYEILDSCPDGSSKSGSFDLSLAQWSNWESWSACSEACDQRRNRQCSNCPEDDDQVQQQVRRCNSDSCFGRRLLSQVNNDNAEWESWGPWTDCQQYCGGKK